ncbi:MAG: hypothetical protein ACPG19_14230 [Saprospiraceae bacterium]
MWFSSGQTVNLLNDASDRDYKEALDKVAGLEALVKSIDVPKADKYLFMELALQGLSVFQVVSKEIVEQQLRFRDLLANMLNDDDDDGSVWE